MGISLTGKHVVGAFEDRVGSQDFPSSITVDHGTEFTSTAVEAWAFYFGVELDFTRLGKPTDNGHVESFNGRLRGECLKFISSCRSSTRRRSSNRGAATTMTTAPTARLAT